ncbi:hypothetical protein ACFFSY_19765 [Paenibacillus aurantiacus]|uniref:Uncharacterized protein n=1 Tax=Paenibacillus aurantiacus TaxID=1936118 RepID=A0ABV5KSI1_9BACL
MTTMNAYAVRLVPYFNAKGVSWPEQNIWGCMEHTNTSLPGLHLPNNETIQCQGIPFSFPRTDTTEDDHISCEGQTLHVGVERPYRQLALLGVSTWGDYEDGITFAYAAGERTFRQTRKLGLSDLCRLWDYQQLSYGERVGLRFPFYWQGTRAIQFPVGIWLQTLELDAQAALQTIELPDNPYMYIFAMTLI